MTLLSARIRELSALLERKAEPGQMATVKDLVSKYRKLLDIKAVPQIVIRDNLNSKWLGQLQWFPNDPANGYTMLLQRRALTDANTLERIVAHEMVHLVVATETHAKNAEFIARGIRVVYDKSQAHGDRWQEVARQINSLVGKANFVTVTSDADYVLDTETKPYWLLIVTAPGYGDSKLGCMHGVRLTPRMRTLINVMVAAKEYRGRLAKVTDPRWVATAKIGSGSISVPREAADQLKLKILYDQAEA